MHVQRCFPELWYSERCVLQKEPGRCSSFRVPPFLNRPSEECTNCLCCCVTSTLLCFGQGIVTLPLSQGGMVHSTLAYLEMLPRLGFHLPLPSLQVSWCCAGNQGCVHLDVSADSLQLSELDQLLWPLLCH